jgi:hypothetical protein
MCLAAAVTPPVTTHCVVVLIACKVIGIVAVVLVVLLVLVSIVSIPATMLWQ